jgi:small-conductance mechanosensitive channel
MHRIRSIFIFLAVVLVGGMTQAQAQEQNFSQLATGWDRTLREMEGRADQPVTPDGVEELRTRINEVRAQATSHRRDVTSRAEELRTQLESLGPAPENGAPAEAPEIKVRRAQLNGALADQEGQIKQCDLIIIRSENVLRRIASRQFERRTDDLLVQLPPPYELSTWLNAGTQVVSITRQLQRREVVKEGRDNLIVLPLVVLGTYVAIVLGRKLRLRIQQRYGRDPAIARPGYGRRWIAAAVEGVSGGLIPVVLIVILLSASWWLVVDQFVDVPPPWGLLTAIAFYLITAALVRAAFSPDLPNWRVSPVSEAASAKIGWRLNALALVFAVNMAVSTFFDQIYEPSEFFSLHSFILNLFLAIVLLSLLPTKLWQTAQHTPEWFEEGARRTPSDAFSVYPRVLLGIIAVTALAANVLGYAALADYLLHNALYTLLMVGSMVALRALLREVFAHLVSGASGFALAVKRTLALSEQGGKFFNIWGLAGIDLLLVASGVLAGLILWGIPPGDLFEWLFSIFKGVTVGSYRFSLGDILLAVVVFVALLVVTRLVQRFLEFRLLPNMGLDIGVRTAITSGLGYVGVAAALLAAISTLGINLTGLAVVAGALSVGIGFGLQNIVNNFISGIILLIERPVKVGDTVAIKEHEGVIRHIRVRSTEIETRQHASVIIPNADFLQSAVVNWTHRDRAGRVDIRLTVAYNTDIDKVEALLLTCARQHAHVSQYPQPVVWVNNFNDRGVELQLGFHLADIDDKNRVASEVRKAILRALAVHGINIPVAGKTDPVASP